MFRKGVAADTAFEAELRRMAAPRLGVPGHDTAVCEHMTAL